MIDSASAYITTLLAYIPSTGLLFGILLLAAIAGGYIAHLLRVPRVVGYLLGGAASHVFLTWLLAIQPQTASHAELIAAEKPLRAVKDLGLGLILFSIGGVFQLQHIRAVGRRVWRVSLVESVCTALLVFLAVAPALLVVRGTEHLPIVLCFSLLLAVAAIATAPAATLVTLREYDAKGPTTDMILSLTGLNNIICIVAFNVLFMLLAAAGYLGEVDLPGRVVYYALVAETLGSAALGLTLGFVISVVHAKLRIAESLLILTAILIVAGAGENWLLKHGGISYNFLLTTLCMGAVFSNIAIDPERLENNLRTMGQPILVGFFVIAGYRMHLEELWALGLVGIAYVVARLIGKTLGVWAGLKWIKRGGELHPAMGAAMLCQAAVVIGLADFVQTHWLHPWAPATFATTVYGSVVIFEICGPILIRFVVVHAGEVKAVTLLRRSGTSATSGGVVALTWQALLRTFGLAARKDDKASGTLTVKHVMRSNVKCMRASDSLDDVLHFIEQSRYNHFPVIDDDEKLVGVIHFSDIRNIIYNPALATLVTAGDLATTTQTPALLTDTPLNELLDVFHAGDVGCLPVIDGPESRRVVGIIEQRDVLRALHANRAKTPHVR